MPLIVNENSRHCQLNVNMLIELWNLRQLTNEIYCQILI